MCFKHLSLASFLRGISVHRFLYTSHLRILPAPCHRSPRPCSDMPRQPSIPRSHQHAMTLTGLLPLEQQVLEMLVIIPHPFPFLETTFEIYESEQVCCSLSYRVLWALRQPLARQRCLVLFRGHLWRKPRDWLFKRSFVGSACFSEGCHVPCRVMWQTEMDVSVGQRASHVSDTIGRALSDVSRRR